MPLYTEKRRSAGSFCSIGSLGSLFGLDDEDDEVQLSEYQQQSLSVFESEHMWAHFKAQLAESNIQTTAGVRAMLPEFVNDRVRDGSVRSEQRSVSSVSMELHESLGARSISTGGASSIDLDNHIYPAAMRRQESFGMNTVLYGQPRTRSINSSTHRRTPSGSSLQSSEHDIIDAYNQAIRGDTENVLSLYGSENENDVNLLTSVSRRLSKMTSSGDTDAPKRFSSTVARSNSVFSKWSTNDDLRSSNISGASDLSPHRRPKAGSDGSGKSRPKFRRPSTSADEDDPTSEQQQHSWSDFNTPRRPSESSRKSDCLSEMSGLLDDVLLLAQEQIETLDAIKIADSSAGSFKINSFRPNAFSYQPQRNKGDRKENPQVHVVEPVFDENSNTETNDSFAYTNELGCNDAPQYQSVPSFSLLDTGHTLLVEWGEGDSSSEDEDDMALLDNSNSENAVVKDRGDLVCSSHDDEENSCRIPAAQLNSRPNLKRGMMALISSLTSEMSKR